MKHLTHSDEKQLLTYLCTRQPDFNGAARAVYFCDEYLKSILGLDSTDYVIKVALGVGGLKQLEAEVNCWINYRDAIPLAEIVVVGRYVEVMEQVTPEDWTDFADEWSDVEEYIDCYGLEGEDADAAREAAELIDSLEEVFGYTGDNGQLGRDQYGVLVAYDYGFTAGEGGQTSNIYNYVYNQDLMQEYLHGLCDLLNAETGLLLEFETSFLRNSCQDDDYIDHERKSEFRILGIKDDNSKFELIVDTTEEVECWTSMLKSYKVTQIISEKHYGEWCWADCCDYLKCIHEEDEELFQKIRWRI